MIKKILLILGLFSLGLNSFVSSAWIEQESVLNIPFLYNGLVVNNTNTYNYDMLLQNNGNFLFNNSFKIFKYNKTDSTQRNYIIFRNDGKLYLLYASSGTNGTYPTPKIQGYLNGFCECDIENRCGPNLSTDYDYPPITDYSSYFHNNSPYSQPDFITIERSDGSQFCFGYDDIGKKLCFQVRIGYDNSNGLTGSLNITNMEENYLNTITNLFENSPGTSSGGNNNTGWTGNNYYCPTFKQILEMQPAQYNTGLCYNGTLKYENGTITTVQKQDIQTVFTDYEEFTQRINVYYNNCNTPATQSQCENAFNGEREKYSIIANTINNRVDDKGLWNYCNIWLNYDLNATTCTASGYVAEQPTTQELIKYIENIGNIGEIMTPTTGNVLDNLIGSGTVRENREELANRDVFGQLDQIKDKITSLFENRNGVNGIIPDYILWLILASLLLTVLLKK